MPLYRLQGRNGYVRPRVHVGHRPCMPWVRVLESHGWVVLSGSWASETLGLPYSQMVLEQKLNKRDTLLDILCLTGVPICSAFTSLGCCPIYRFAEKKNKTRIKAYLLISFPNRHLSHMLLEIYYFIKLPIQITY